jgi:hypothetical protein
VSAFLLGFLIRHVEDRHLDVTVAPIVKILFFDLFLLATGVAR